MRPVGSLLGAKMWTLTIYMALTWAGPGAVAQYDFPDATSCFQALNAMRLSDSPIAESKEKKSVVAVCHPKEQPK